ncbi:MOSC domain-containing protein [Marivivens sp. LCG002]|uniref:MOSC domain-containing protein n=1 Tax=Marivivens sp. LCG002 TaxID=3051171 RepID=UPI0025571FB7|nr:MOSC domain-containing protein [Marivivens sp. LCG002]WIV50315.1 MOSC domain-containing protein [Marivivens sp. LCG002]
MPALKPTDFSGTIVWLGLMPERSGKQITAQRREALDLTFAGAVGDAHYGETRPSCVRVTAQYPKDTPIRNTRQISLVSEEELAQIALRLGMERIDPLWLGATIVVRGIPDFSFIPPSSRLQFESGATVTVDMQNRPCSVVRDTIAAHENGQGAAFVQSARGRRGVTAWVEREGKIAVGDALRVHVPDQRGWKP